MQNAPPGPRWGVFALEPILGIGRVAHGDQLVEARELGELCRELRGVLRIERGLLYQRQFAISVCYKGREVGDYVVDLLVENTVILELKSTDRIIRAHEAQLLNYLRATSIRVGLLLNFGTPRLGIRRLVF